ncbi:MAG: ABC transporter permease [Planctomycetota bacterium]|jgi:ABC-2 type transport system permease protein
MTDADSIAPAKSGRPASVVWPGIWTLTRREMVRFVRQRSRFAGALAQPVMFWVLFGAGLHGSFKAPEWAATEMSYQEYFFPGIAVLILMFTAIFSSISIIEDRHEGFLQGVLVSPLPRWGLVVGKLAGGTLLALLQAALFVVIGQIMAFLGVAPSMSTSLSVMSSTLLILFMAVVAFSLTGLGFIMAWKLDSVQGFHAVMSVFLMPMWLVSGAFFPGGESGFLAGVIRLNPLTYGVAGIRRLMYSSAETLPVSGALPSLGVCLAATMTFATLTLAGSILVSRQTISRQSSRQSKERK